MTSRVRRSAFRFGTVALLSAGALLLALTWVTTARDVLLGVALVTGVIGFLAFAYGGLDPVRLATSSSAPWEKRAFYALFIAGLGIAVCALALGSGLWLLGVLTAAGALIGRRASERRG